MCKACFGLGHCITNPDNICYNVAKQKMCSKYLKITEHNSVIKSSTYRYKKDQKGKVQQLKVTSKMDGIIRSMEEDGHSTQDIAPIIHIAKAFAFDTKIR